ncbi:MAG: hypothetical protein ACSHWS_10930 [Sulfitobacter sp.]
MDVVHKWPKAMQIWPKLSGLGADLTAAIVSPDFEDDRFPAGAIVGDLHLGTGVALPTDLLTNFGFDFVHNFGK